MKANAITDTCGKSFAKEDMIKLFREYVINKFENRELIQYIIESEGSQKFKEVRIIVHYCGRQCENICGKYCGKYYFRERPLQGGRWTP